METFYYYVYLISCAYIRGIKQSLVHSNTIKKTEIKENI